MRHPSPPRSRFGRSFAVLFVASTASNVGDGILLSAAPLLARGLTDDPLAVSAVAIGATAPWLVFGLAAGAIVDRRSRLAAMVAVDIARAAGLTLIALAVVTDVLSLPLLVVAMFALGLGETIFDTAAQATLPRLVQADRLEAANGRLFGAQLAANGFVGPLSERSCSPPPPSCHWQPTLQRSR